MRQDPRASGLLLGDGVEIGADVGFGAYAVIHDGVRIGDGATLGAHVVIHDGVKIEDGAMLGAHVVVHEGTVIGDGCVIEDHVVLGKRPRLARSSSARGDVGALRLGTRVTVCAGAVVLAGARLGDEAIVGDQAYVRERAAIGAGSLVGRGSVVDNDVVVGERVKLQTNVYITAFSTIEDDVFVGPGASTTNDDTMSRHGSETPLRGATLRRACRIGGGAVLTPGVEVGEEAFLAAGAVLTRDLPPRAVAMGVPARVVREVGEEDLIERWR